MGVGGQRHASAALPLGKTRYPLYRRPGRPQGHSGWVQKISPLPGFDHRTVQPVACQIVTLQVPRIWNQPLDFCYICGPLTKILEIGSVK